MRRTERVLPVMPRIRSFRPSFSRAESKVAETVLQAPDVVVYSSVTELAARADVGETTVLRFARRLGYRSFQAFKIDLARDLTEQEGLDVTLAPEDIESESGLREVTERNQRAVLETYRLLQPADLHRAVELLSAARTIHFYGVGHSNMVAMDAAYRLMRIGFPTRAFSDTHFQMMAASALSPEDVAVGLSVSGSAKDTVEALRTGYERGANTIAITSHAKAPIARFARVMLLTATRESPLEAGCFASSIGQFHVLDLITTALIRANRDRVRQHQESVNREISQKLY